MRRMQSRCQVAVLVLGELTGFTGSCFDNDRTAARAGIQLERGHGTLYIGVSAAMVTARENIGARTGFICSFEPVRLFADD
jgi:hypothetical protein